MKKVAWIFILIVVISGIYIGLKNFNYKVPDKYNAMITHKELLISNSGENSTEPMIVYKYYFYRGKNNTYKFIKTKSKESVVGEGKTTKVKTGKIKSQSEMSKISEDIEKDYKAIENSKKVLEFKFMDGGSSRNCSSLKVLFEKMFPKA